MDITPAAAATVNEVAAHPRVREALTWAGRNEGVLAHETVRVAEIPAPTFDESARAGYMAAALSELGLEAVEVGADENVYALLPGAGPDARPALALFAHLDTVFGHDVDVTVSKRDGRLYVPGVGDNSAGIAGVLCALRAMREAGVQPDRPVWIVGTVGEEGLGDLRGARAATERLADDCDAVIAVEGSFFGRVSHTAVGSRRWRVRMHAEGGHSWHDFGRPSAVHALVTAAAQIAALRVPSEPRTTFNIGEVRGGTGVNVIAECAELVIDMRSVDAAALDALATRIRSIVEGSAGAGVRVEIAEVGYRPAGAAPAAHPLVQTCAAVLTHLGVAPQYAAASTDANAPLGRGIPAVTLGVTRGGGAHTLGEWIEVTPMIRGVQQLILALCTLSDRRVQLRSTGDEHKTRP